MALIMEQKPPRGSNWFAISVFIFVFALIVLGGYFLFFSPTPLIDTIVPSGGVTVETISEVKLDSSKIVNDPVLKTFREYGTVPSIGTVGRPNPFSSL